MNDLQFVYRLIDAADWRALAPDADIPLRDIDRKDGYLHLSSQAQLLETANLHFADAREPLALEIEAGALGPALKWEASRGGALFPHLYAPLPRRSVARAIRLAGAPGAYEWGAPL